MFHSKKQIILSSLLSVFLVGTLVITSTLMVNPNFSLDIRNYAKSQLEPEEEAFLKKVTNKSSSANTTNSPANNSNSEPKERKERIQRDDEIKDDPSAPAAVAPPVVTPPPAAIKTDEQIEEDFLRKNLQNKQTTSATTTTSPTSAPLPSTTTQTTPTTKTDEQIEQEFMEKRQSSIAQSSTQTTPTPTPIKTPTPAPTIKTDEQIEQEYMEKRQKTVAQSPIKTPTPTPNTAMEQFRCGERGGDWINGQCQSPGKTPAPTPIKTPTPVKTPTPTPNTSMEQFRCGERGGDWINGQCQSPGSTPTPKPTLPPMTDPGYAKAVVGNDINLIQSVVVMKPSSLVAAILSNPIVQKALPYLATADVVDTAIASVQCGLSGNQNSPACQAAVASLIAPPGAGFADDVVDLVDSLAKPVNNLLDNTVFSGLTNDEYWGGGFSNSGGQTLLSRSNMPANLTPQEQSLWLSKADIVENWNNYQTYGSPSRYTNVGYQPNAAAELYQPSNINEALDNVPDPLGIIKNLEQQSSLGANPAEILANSRSYIESNGIIILEIPPPTGQWWVNTPNGQGTSWSEGLSEPLSNSTTFGIYRGPNDGIALSVEGTKFALPSNSNFPLPYTPYRGDTILLNRQALDTLGPSKELQTVIHEAGHAVESSYTPQVTSNFWYKNQETEKWMVSQETGAAATEYISTLYGIKAAQALAPTNINMAIDTMIPQLLLNTNIINPNPTYLLNN